MNVIELSIDLGSKFTTIYQKGVGTVLREPSLALIQKGKGGKTEIREAGYRAKSVMESSLGSAQVVAPIKEGVVVDCDMAALMLEYFLGKIVPKGLFAPKIEAIVSISSSSTASERQAAEKCCLKAGIREVTLVEAPLSLYAYTRSIGGLFIDIGGGKTEISAVTGRGIAAGCTVNIAGDAFNAAIIDRVYTQSGARLGDITVENLKQSALSFYLDDVGNYAVSGSGRDGAPKNFYVSADDLREAVLPLVDNIIEVIASVLAQTPPELSAEILRKGVFASGGSFRIPGLIEYLEQEQALGLTITPLDDLETAVAKGAAAFFDDRDMLSDMIGVKLK